MSKGSGKRKTSTKRKSTNRKNQKRTEEEHILSNEILLIFVFAIGVLLFLCNFGIIGPIGDSVSKVMFGIFGLTGYVAPIFVFIAMAFGISNQGNTMAIIKLVSSIVLFFMVGVILEIGCGVLKNLETYSLLEIYQYSADNKLGGGIIAGSIAYLMYHFLDMAGTILVLIVIMLICIVIITGKSLINGVKEGSQKVYSTAKEDAEYRRELLLKRREENNRKKTEQNLERESIETSQDAERILRMNRKVSGVMMDTMLKDNNKGELYRDDIHEITVHDLPDEVEKVKTVARNTGAFDELANIKIHSANMGHGENDGSLHSEEENEPIIQTETERVGIPKNEGVSKPKPVASNDASKIQEDIKKSKIQIKKKYNFPPLSCLRKVEKDGTGISTRQLKETALRLQQTLNNFGVKVTITDISQGPTVTRYELQPETGVKVSKIVGLSDDIKLNLAATDIRIEAPIPGKAAVGIEVPNKENSAVSLRELIESKEFKEFNSNITFAVGKDISGHVVVSDIAKMPHMLIAGATGSGKSVCINTIIMGILYKAHPDDVKMIMVDPKVVELSVYNGIPHLLIPVVTDPKKAAGALHWGVAEMTERYKKFADMNVRDLRGYNKQVQIMKDAHAALSRYLLSTRSCATV